VSIVFDLVRDFTEMICPGGHEEAFNRALAERWAPYLKSSGVSAVGNFYGLVGGSGPRVALVAHSDEVAFAVRSIDDRGFIRVASGQRDPAGRPFQRGPYFLPLGHTVLVLGDTEQIEGVFATVTGHVLTHEQQEQHRLEWRDVFVDVGATCKADVEAHGIHPGTRIVWNPPTRRMGSFIYGKAMDDRGALAIMEAYLRELDPESLGCELWVASTIREETGLVGAGSVNRDIDAQYAIALDVGLVGDIPNVDPLDVPTCLGGGPIIVQNDLSGYTQSVVRAIEEAAEGAGIPFQRAVFNLYGSDANEFVRQGIASALIAYPTRYTHSPFEMVHEEDLRACVRLLHAVLGSPFWSSRSAP
jgi:tetrahedral aminopeptidase